jgi:glyoxylase-like metal-dependent hydrolase (beta-lactamase superfamily II)
VHEDIVVVLGAIWKTTCTLVRSGDEAFLIDSPILPEELDALPSLAEQAGFGVAGLLVTHADWDHLLGPYAFGEASLGCGQSTADRLRAEPQQAQHQLRDFDEEYLIDRPGPLSLGEVQALPVPGYCALGERELQLYAADGHTADGTAIWIPWAHTLICGDYLSPEAIPELSPGGSIEGYLATLERLAGLIEQARTIVPGHGAVLSPSEADTVLREDRAYLLALREHGAKAPLPASRQTAAQASLHRSNLQTIS